MSLIKKFYSSVSFFLASLIIIFYRLLIGGIPLYYGHLSELQKLSYFFNRLLLVMSTLFVLYYSFRVMISSWKLRSYIDLATSVLTFTFAFAFTLFLVAYISMAGWRIRLF